MADKLTLEQFGQRIKAKHPEYADIADADLGSKVLAKHPEYADMVEQRNFLQKGWDALTGGLLDKDTVLDNIHPGLAAAVQSALVAPTVKDSQSPNMYGARAALAHGANDVAGLISGLTSPAAAAMTASKMATGVGGLLFGGMGAKQTYDNADYASFNPNGGIDINPDKLQNVLMGMSGVTMAPGMIHAGAGTVADSINKAATKNANTPVPGKYSPEELQNFADANDIPATPAQVTGSKFMQRVQDIGRGSLLAGRSLENRINSAASGVKAKYEKLLGSGATNTVNNLTSQLGTSSTPEVAGQSVQDAVTTASSKMRSDVRQAYADVDKRANGVTLDFPNTRAWAKSALAQLETRAKTAPELLDSGTVSLLKRAASLGVPEESEPQLSSILDASGRPIEIAPAPTEPLSFSDAQDLRSGFLRASSVDGTPLPSESKSLLRGIGSALDTDMQTAAQDNPQLMPAFRKASGLSKELHQVFDDPAHPISRIYNATDPASVMGIIRGGGNGGSTFLANALTKYSAVTPEMKQALIRSMGDPNGTGQFDENLFLQNMGKNSDSFLSKMFSPDEVSQLTQAAKQAVIRNAFDRSQGEGDMTASGAYSRLTTGLGKHASRFLSRNELRDLQQLAKLHDSIAADSNTSGTAHVAGMGMDAAAMAGAFVHPSALAFPVAKAAATGLSMSPMLAPGYAPPAPPSIPARLSFLLAPSVTSRQEP